MSISHSSGSLIAARDELQLGAGTSTIGESSLMVRQPRNYHEAFHLFVQNRLRIGGFNRIFGHGSVDVISDLAELIVELLR
jgi:hypothetical protein